jgi:hypothetical protein
MYFRILSRLASLTAGVWAAGLLDWADGLEEGWANASMTFTRVRMRNAARNSTLFFFPLK